MTYSSIRPGEVWRDTNGKPIQAHGFSVFYNEKDGLYYWYGENKEKTKGGFFNKVWHWGVRCYTSKDLYNWEDRGLIIPPQPDDLTSPLHPTYCMDRPHIIYCEKTGKYVAWLKIMAGEVSQFMSVMQADDFMGPYEFVHKIYKPLEMDTGDFALHVDGETKKAYIFFERPHFELVTATLSDTYTEVSGEYSEHYKGLLPPYTREAPTYFERNGKKYLFTSGTSGYYPNKSQVCVFDDYHGEYKDLGNPHIGDATNTSFSSQITCVLKIPGERLAAVKRSGAEQQEDLYIACADRWMPGKMAMKMSAQVIKGMERHFADYKPDYSPRKAEPLPGKLLKHSENTSKSTYVWLPIEWEGEKPVIRWRDEWKL